MSEKTPFDFFHHAITQFRTETDKFAKAYPNAANHLQLGAQVMEDPHVSRLIESIAFIQGQVQAQLEDNFSKVTQGLLHILFPEHTAPLASMSIIKFAPMENLSAPFTIPKGTLLESPAVDSDTCYFQLGYETEILPVHLSHVSLQNLTEPVMDFAFDTYDQSLTFEAIKPKTIRLYIDADPSLTVRLLDSLFKSLRSIQLISGDKILTLNNSVISPVGFAADQQLLPKLSLGQQPYANLMEFVHYIEKFYFFDLNINPDDWEQCHHSITFRLKFTDQFPQSMAKITKDNFKLNCGPILNLFEKHLEPLEINHQQERYPIIIDKRSPEHFQLHYLTQVNNANKNEPVANRFIIGDKNKTPFSYHLQRNGTPIKDGFNINDCALELSDCEDMLTMLPIVLELKGWCSNGTLPNQLIWPKHIQHLQAVELALPVEKIECLTQPTPYATEHLTQHRLQRVLQLLQQQQLGLLNPKNAKECLVNLISLYITSSSKATTTLTDAIIDVEVKPTKKYLADALGNPLQFGFEVRVKLNKQTLSNVSLWLFSRILRDCYAFHTPINQFVELSVEVNHA